MLCLPQVQCVPIVHVHDHDTITLCCAGPSDVPRDFAGEVVDSTTVALTWNPPPQESQNGIIRKYIISATEMDTGVEYSWESVSTGIEIHSLHPFYTYQFTVAAYTVQQGPSSYIVTLKTPEDSKLMLIG